jgi:hypothetical protein
VGADAFPAAEEAAGRLAIARTPSAVNRHSHEDGLGWGKKKGLGWAQKKGLGWGR